MTDNVYRTRLLVNLRQIVPSFEEEKGLNVFARAIEGTIGIEQARDRDSARSMFCLSLFLLLALVARERYV